MSQIHALSGVPVTKYVPSGLTETARKPVHADSEWSNTCSAAPLAGKVIDGEIKLSSQETERYMGKFSFSPFARSRIAASFHVNSGQYFDQHPHDLTLCLYDEQQWREFNTAMKKGSLCRDRMELAKWSTHIRPVFNDEKKRRDFSFDEILRPPHARAHYWFAVLMDCYLEVRAQPRLAPRSQARCRFFYCLRALVSRSTTRTRRRCTTR